MVTFAGCKHYCLQCKGDVGPRRRRKEDQLRDCGESLGGKNENREVESAALENRTTIDKGGEVQYILNTGAICLRNLCFE